MGEFSTASSASPLPQEKNYADFCDALNAERWLRLLDATRRAREVRSLAVAPEHAPGTNGNSTAGRA